MVIWEDMVDTTLTMDMDLMDIMDNKETDKKTSFALYRKLHKNPY